MAQFMVEIELSGAAFEDSGELAGLLRVLADRVEVQVVDEKVTHNASAMLGVLEGWVIRDSNGNRIGHAWVQEA